MILASFHGLPREYLTKGDPYNCHCMKTARFLRETMNVSLSNSKWCSIARRPGRVAQPYAQATVEGLPAKGVKNLVMIMPGFSADCVETLEEVAIGLNETFKHAGGVNFSAVPCLKTVPHPLICWKNLCGRSYKGGTTKVTMPQTLDSDLQRSVGKLALEIGTGGAVVRMREEGCGKSRLPAWIAGRPPEEIIIDTSGGSAGGSF